MYPVTLSRAILDTQSDNSTFHTGWK